MYSEYEIESDKLQCCRFQDINNRFCYFIGGISIANSALHPTQNLNIEYNRNILKMPKIFQHELEEFGKLTYEYENDEGEDNELDLFSRSTLPKYRINKYDSYHDHYFYNTNEYQQEKQNQQCRPHHREHRHSYSDHNHNHPNSKKSSYGDVYNKRGMPPSVHQRFVNKCNFNFNTNNNSNLKNNDNRFIGEHRQILLATECLQLQPSNPPILNTVSEGHYLHYYSYFCNRNINSSILAKPGRESQLMAKYDLIYAEENNLDGDNNYNTLNKSRMNYRNYVLKEKTTNNNDVVAYGHGSKQYCLSDVEQLKCAGRDYFDVKFVENCEFNTDKKNINVINTCDQIKRPQKIKVLNDNEENLSRNVNLPSTPGKCRTPVKKLSPSPKNRRVLIYNIQSPRLSRLSASRIRPQRAKFRVHDDTKVENNKLFFVPSLRNEANENKLRKLNFMSPIKDLSKIDCDISNQKNGNYNKDISKGSDNSDDDDNFDEVSNFDSSTDSDISSDSEEGYKAYVYKLTHSLDIISTRPSVESSVNSEYDSLDNPKTLLVPSLFPNVPPYLAFSSNTKKGPEVPADLYRILKWRVTNVMPRVVRTILDNSGMRLIKKTNDWMGVWGKHMKSPCFKTIQPYQKINHLPGSFKIGRKDSCWKNLVKLMAKHGKKDFGFMPKTYIIPNDLKQLRKNWPKYVQKNVKWIIKPPAGARGTGIRVVDRWAQIPKRKPLIVQKYIERPLLINGSKFDLRLYVLVTSINPLRVYMYHNGLARFASVKYSDKSDTLNDRCMHLTNYSINKFSSNYSKNEDVNACHGHKWTIKSLWSYLERRGIKTELLWIALRSLVLRTILAGENSINNMIRANVESKYSCFELFGFDVLLDADLVPWLLEVNISPSLHSELPLDSHVKAPLVQSVLNTALYNIPPKISIERQKEIAMEMSLPSGSICYDKRMYINYLSRTEKIKHNRFTRKSLEDRDKYIDAILDNLTPDDVRCLIIAEDELARCSPLERIFPTIDTYKYLKYTETPRYYNRLLDAWETRYAKNRVEGINLLRQLCEDGYHLKVPQIPTKKACWRAILSLFWRCRAVYYRFFGKTSEMDIKIIITVIVFVTIASVTFYVISYFVVKYTPHVN